MGNVYKPRLLLLSNQPKLLKMWNCWGVNGIIVNIHKIHGLMIKGRKT